MAIRLARLSDANNLAALSIHVWLHTYAKDGVRASFSNYVLQEFTAGKFEAALADLNNPIWIFEKNNSLVAYLKLLTESPCPDYPDCSTEIEALYVHSHFTNQGVGSALLQSALHSCREKEFSHVWLSVNHENQLAIKFYQKHLFTKIGSIMFELDDDCHENFVLLKSIS